MDKGLWIRKQQRPLSFLPKLCDQVDSLWINGYHSRNGLNDRIPEETVKEIMEILDKTGEWHGEINNIKKD